jgi:hypothetical protein
MIALINNLRPQTNSIWIDRFLQIIPGSIRNNLFEYGINHPENRIGSECQAVYNVNSNKSGSNVQLIALLQVIDHLLKGHTWIRVCG